MKCYQIWILKGFSVLQIVPTKDSRTCSYNYYGRTCIGNIDPSSIICALKSFCTSVGQQAPSCQGVIHIKVTYRIFIQ